jgi:hypothetical protein
VTESRTPDSTPSSWTPWRRVIFCAGGFAFVLVISLAFRSVFGEGTTIGKTLLQAAPIGLAVVMGLYVGTAPRRTPKKK